MDKLNKVAIIIPFYRDTLFEFEEIALEQCEKILPGHPKIAIKPFHLALPDGAYKCKFTDIVSFDDGYFKGHKRI